MNYPFKIYVRDTKMAFITGITLMKNEKIWIEESPRIEDIKRLDKTEAVRM